MTDSDTVLVRYIVDDVDAALDSGGLTDGRRRGGDDERRTGVSQSILVT